MKTARTTASMIRRYGLSAGLVLGLVGAATASARAHDAHGPHVSHARPLPVVYVAVELDGGHGRHRGPALDQRRLMDALARSLPAHVRLIDARDRRIRPDVTVRLDERFYDVGFAVIDRDRADAPYRKDTWLAGCGPLYEASFTRVTERATARYGYDVRIDSRFAPDRTAHVKGEESDRFKYGANLTAHGACGTVTRAPMPPADWVSDLFARAEPSSRSGLAAGLRLNAAEDMGRKVAALIGSESGRILEARHDGGRNRYYASAGRP